MWLLTISKMYPAVRLDDPAVALLWKETLSCYSAEQIEAAFRRLIREYKYPTPIPALICEYIREANAQIGDYAPLVRGLLPEPPLSDELRQEMLAEVRGKLKRMPKVSRVVVVTEEMRAKIEEQKRKLGA